MSSEHQAAAAAGTPPASQSNSLSATLEAGIDSPAITVDSPHSTHHQTSSSSSRGTSRSRSLSPSSPPPISLASSVSGFSPPSPLSFASRPSPVVPSPSVPGSPTFSRPTSPTPRDRSLVGGTQPGSPARSTHDLSLSVSGSQPDLTHIFERDVEFHATHHISPQEAVDVAIPPVLDEAAVALSSSDELSSSDLASIVRESEDVGSGWSSPALPPATPHPHNTSRSPVRQSSARSRSPDSPSSIGPPLLPVSHAGAPSGHAAKPSFSVGAVPFPSSTASSTDHLATSASIDALGETEPTMRRLSFTSYADLLNEERLADLQGNTFGAGGTPGRSVSSTGARDLVGALEELQVREGAEA